MSSPETYTLDVLKRELAFLEAGGYEDPDLWIPALIFEDSPTCIHPDRSLPHSCARCPLMMFVPEGRKETPVPCRHIPLNSEGYTLDSMYHWNSGAEIRAIVTGWLRKTIAKLEAAEPLQGKRQHNPGLESVFRASNCDAGHRAR